MIYKINFILTFIFSKLIPFCVILFISQKMNKNDYVHIEIILALSLFLSNFLSFGMQSILNILKSNNFILKIRSAHIQIVSFFSLILSILFNLSDFFFLSLLSAITSSIVILNSIINDLRLLRLKIISNLIEPLIYIVFIISLVFYFYNPLLEFQNLSSLLFIMTSFILLFINIYNYGLNFNIKYKTKKVLELYLKSYNILFFSLILILINIYPRVFINFLDPNEAFDFLLGFRVSFLAFFIHQLFTNFFHYELFKENLKKFKIIFIISTFLTFIFSLIIVYLYFYIIEIQLFNLKYFNFNKLIFFQILFLSIVSYFNILILRLKKLAKQKKIFFNLIIFFYILTFLTFKFYSNSVNILIYIHLIMIFSYIFIVYLKKINLKL